MSDVRQSAEDLGLGGPAPQSADAIDRVVRLAPTWTIFALIACGLLVAGTVYWAFAGTVTTSVAVPAVFRDEGDQLVAADDSGVIDKILIKVGDDVRKGDVVATFSDGTEVVSPGDGEVTLVLVTPGVTVLKGKSLAAISDPDKPGNVVTMLPPKMVGTIEVGQRVEMSVNSAPSNTYGYMKGYVSQLSSAPVTVKEVAQALDIEVDLVIAEAGPDPGILAEITPVVDRANMSGFAWTTGDGPDFALVQGTGISAQVIISETAPINVVFPQLNVGRSESP